MIWTIQDIQIIILIKLKPFYNKLSNLVRRIFIKYFQFFQLSVKHEIMSKQFTPDRRTFSFICASGMWVTQLVEYCWFRSLGFCLNFFLGVKHACVGDDVRSIWAAFISCKFACHYFYNCQIFLILNGKPFLPVRRNSKYQTLLTNKKAYLSFIK